MNFSSSLPSAILSHSHKHRTILSSVFFVVGNQIFMYFFVQTPDLKSKKESSLNSPITIRIITKTPMMILSAIDWLNPLEEESLFHDPLVLFLVYLQLKRRMRKRKKSQLRPHMLFHHLRNVFRYLHPLHRLLLGHHHHRLPLDHLSPLLLNLRRRKRKDSFHRCQ